MYLPIKEYKYNFIFAISLFFLLFLFISLNPLSIILISIFVAFFIFQTVYGKRWKIQIPQWNRKIIGAFIWSGIILFIIYEILRIQDAIQFYSLFFVVLSAFSVFICVNECSKKIKIRNYTFQKIIPYSLFLFVAIFFTSLCSRSSWMYAINDASDPNIFLTVGKDVMNGKILYKDIFEQKGPYIFLLHGLASFISSNSMAGVFCLEVIVNWIFLIIGRKIIRLYVKNDWISLIGVPVGFAIYISSNCFWYGDNAEELCSPFLIYGLYILLKNLKEKRLPSKKEYICIGMTSGFILWVKYTMLGFYLGWYIVPFFLMVRKKDWKAIFESIGWIVGGVFLISLPVLLYFVWNHALHSLWEVYFYDNIFLYTTKSSNQNLFLAIFNAVKINVVQNIGLSLLIGLSLIWMSFQTSLNECVAYMCCFLGIIFSTYMGGRYYIYYYSCLAIFMFPGIIYVYCAIRKLTEPMNPFIITLLVLCGSVGFIFSTSRNIAFMNKPKEEYPQYQFAEIMNQVKEPTLLNYGMLDSGFNLYANILPSNRFYCSFNVPLKEIEEEQNEILQNGEVDFFISYDPNLQFEKYHLVASQEYNRGEGSFIYNLYARNDISIKVNDLKEGE